MANATIKTHLKNITDGGTTTSISLDGVPSRVSNIITSRIFTKKVNTVYIVEPYISFKRTKNPNDYTYTRTHNQTSGTTIFTVKYKHPLKPPTTDIIEFFGEAKASITPSTTNFYSYKIDDYEIPARGIKRYLTLYGDPNVAVKVDVTHNPKIGPKVNSKSLIGGEKTVLIGNNGKYILTVDFPATTLLTDYRIKLTEVVAGSFPSNIKSPYTTTLVQYPVSEVRLTISDSALGTTLPSTTTITYKGARGTSIIRDFQFIVSKSVDLALEGTFQSDDITQTDGTSATILDDISVGVGLQNTPTFYDNLKITIDNTASPNTATISGTIRIIFGYNSGGHTLLALDVNDILKNA